MADKLTFGGYSITTPALTALGVDTPAKAAGLTTVGANVNGFDHTTNRLTLKAGQATRTYFCHAYFSAVKAGGGATLGTFYIAKNGVVQPTGLSRTLANTSDVGAVATGAIFELAAGDYVELWLKTANGDDITLNAAGLGIHVVG